MAKMKKGDKMVCTPCGKEVSVGLAGISDTTIWCCGRPMKNKKKVTKKKS